MNIAVLVSGEGTTLQHLIDYSQTNPDVFQIKVVGADRICNGIHRAQKAKIPILDYKNVCKEITLPDSNIDFICLAGFLQKIEMHNLHGRVINVHPALLPAYGGQGMYGDNVHQAVHTSGVWFTGCTIHLCNYAYDSGSILYQEIIPVDPDWSPSEIATAVQKIEKDAYVKVLKAISDLIKGGCEKRYVFYQNRLRRKLNENS